MVGHQCLGGEVVCGSCAERGLVANQCARGEDHGHGDSASGSVPRWGSVNAGLAGFSKAAWRGGRRGEGRVSLNATTSWIVATEEPADRLWLAAVDCSGRCPSCTSTASEARIRNGGRSKEEGGTEIVCPSRERGTMTPQG